MKADAVPPPVPGPALGEEQDGRWVCVSCGFIYDPRRGDPARGFPAGTAFEALPEGWVCPLCYSSKAAFDRY